MLLAVSIMNVNGVRQLLIVFLIFQKLLLINVCFMLIKSEIMYITWLPCSFNCNFGMQYIVNGDKIMKKLKKIIW